MMKLKWLWVGFCLAAAGAAGAQPAPLEQTNPQNTVGLSAAQAVRRLQAERDAAIKERDQMARQLKETASETKRAVFKPYSVFSQVVRMPRPRTLATREPIDHCIQRAKEVFKKQGIVEIKQKITEEIELFGHNGEMRVIVSCAIGIPISNGNLGLVIVIDPPNSDAAFDLIGKIETNISREIP